MSSPLTASPVGNQGAFRLQNGRNLTIRGDLQDSMAAGGCNVYIAARIYAQAS